MKKILLKGGRFNTGFDSGSVQDIVAGKITPYKQITPYGTLWWWYAFSSSKFAGTTPTFKIAIAYYFQIFSNVYRYGCYSTALDSDDWVDFGTPVIGDTYVEFTASTPLPAGTLYFAHMPAYPFSRVQRKVAGWLTHAYAADTVSSTNGVLGNSTARVCTLDNKYIPSLPYYGFKISKTSANTKNKAILSSGTHPGESIARFSFEGMVDWILGGSAEAETLLDWFDFYIYPCTCPDGVYAGLFRASSQNLALDYNRVWNTTGSLEGVNLIKASMLADTGSAIEVGMDFHCSNNNDNSRQNYGNAYGDTSGNHSAFETIMKSLDGATYNLVNFTTAGSLIQFWNNSFTGGTLSICMHPEISGRLEHSVSDIKAYGENHAKAIYQLLVAGSFPNHPS